MLYRKTKVLMKRQPRVRWACDRACAHTFTLNTATLSSCARQQEPLQEGSDGPQHCTSVIRKAAGPCSGQCCGTCAGHPRWCQDRSGGQE